MKRNRKNIIFFIIAVFFLMPFVAVESSSKEEKTFFVEQSYDLHEEGKSNAKLRVVTDYVYFYIDESWWGDLSMEKKEKYNEIIGGLGDIFEKEIRPYIKDNFGNIPKHRVVGEEDRIYVLFHPMTEGSGGYFRSGDQYSIYQYPRSNEKNVLYLNANSIEDLNLPGYLAHEYIHLVTFNEKNRKFRVNEEIWLNELRAEMIISILGYDDDYEKSNLRGRVNTFLRDPDISLTDWTEQVVDYGVISVFGHYLVDHYGEEILTDSLQTNSVGIESINYALEKNGFEKTFAEVFNEWKIAVYLNNCSYGEYYCYKNEDLENIRVPFTNIFLPSRDQRLLSGEYRTKNWAGNWYRIVGGSGTLLLNFESKEKFTVPYILHEKDGKVTVDFINIDEKGKGSVVVEEFNSQYKSVSFIPSFQQETSGFNGPGESVYFQWEVEIRNEEEREKRLAELRERLSLIRKEVEKLYVLAGLEISQGNIFNEIENNLYYGMTNSKEVRNLQRFLKSRGENIYPEGLVTGNFYDLTKKAVVRFQEQHQEEILAPFGISEGTGYVGEKTRKLINSLIEK